MKEDKQIVRLFLSGYANKTGVTFVRIDHPDHFQDAGVDAVALDEVGRTVAVEHTLLQPFPGQKENLTGPLKRVFEPLKRAAVPGRNIRLTVGHDSIRRGQDWARAAEALTGWFEGAKASFPLGWSYHIVMVPPLGLEVHVAGGCKILDEQQGCVSIMYAQPQMEDQFVEAVAHSVERKVGKLVTARADRRILLFQREWLAYSPQNLGNVLNSLATRLPELGQVDEIWLATTTFHKSDGYVDFDQVRPGLRRPPSKWTASDRTLPAYPILLSYFARHFSYDDKGRRPVYNRDNENTSGGTVPSLGTQDLVDARTNALLRCRAW